MGTKLTKNVSRRHVLGGVALVGVGLVLPWEARADKALKISIRGGPARGLYELVGEGLSNVLRQALPGSTISYEPGSSAGNIYAVANGKADVGVCDSIGLKAALAGRPPFPSKLPQGEVFALARLFDTNLVQVFARADSMDRYGIKSLSDIAKKKPGLNLSFPPNGNPENQEMIRALFKHYGFASTDFKKWGGKIFYLNSGATLNLLRDRKVDLFPIGLFAPDARFTDLNRNLPLRLLPVGEGVANALAHEFSLKTHTIPAHAYPFLSHPYVTVGMDSVLIVSRKMSDKVAYELTKGLADSSAKMRAIHKGAFSDFDAKEMAGVTVLPYHPGARRYFKEVGITTGS